MNSPTASTNEWSLYHQAVCRLEKVWNSVNAEDADWALKREAARKELTETERDRILDEEAHACKFGRHFLLELGFDDLNAFDARAATGIAEHKRRLGLL